MNSVNNRNVASILERGKYVLKISITPVLNLNELIRTQYT